MKKILLLAITLIVSSVTYAQLGAPKITVRDTLVIVSASYNGYALNVEDWPSFFIEEDVVNIMIAGYTYKKGKPVTQKLYEFDMSWEGYVDFYVYHAICNGKTEIISIVKPRKDCVTDIMQYTIGDYVFGVMTQSDFIEKYGHELKENDW